MSTSVKEKIPRLKVRSEKLAKLAFEGVSSPPRVSLLVCTRNEADYIEQCLSSILTQDYGLENMEVVVVDGQSTDGTIQIVERMFKDRANCHIVANPGVIQAHGWNVGIDHASGQIIGIVAIPS